MPVRPGTSTYSGICCFCKRPYGSDASLPNSSSRYMAATQHWLKTDIVNDEELRMIRAQVFEAIQRKRSELHNEAAAVLGAERWAFKCFIPRNLCVSCLSDDTSLGATRQNSLVGSSYLRYFVFLRDGTATTNARTTLAPTAWPGMQYKY